MKVFDDHDITAKCPECQEAFDGTTGLSDGLPPQPGNSLSFCAYCGGVSVFGDGLQLRPLTVSEALRLEMDVKAIATFQFAGRAIGKPFHIIQLPTD